MGLTGKQFEFIEMVSENKSVFLTGKAGTGKSYIVKEAINFLRVNGKKVIALAPTGIAANNIGGQTLHSMFSLDPFGVLDYNTCRWLKGEKRRLLNSVDTIVIDEVSMLRPDTLDAIHYTLLKNGCKPLTAFQLIFVGDLKQLPAPIDDNTKSVMLRTYQGFEFHHSNIFDRLNISFIELDEIMRQSDQEFISHLNIVREGGKSSYFKKFITDQPKGIILAPHNTTVSKYNKIGLDAIDGFLYTFTAKTEGNLKADDFNLETVIQVKDGCKIMYLANSKNNPLVNGTLGIFRVYDDNYFIEVKGVDYALEPITFTKKEYVLNKDNDDLELQEIGSITQYPIKLAYALSIHKSQGLTFDQVTIDLTLPCFAKGQVYTALSRVKSPEGLTIITR